MPETKFAQSHYMDKTSFRFENDGFAYFKKDGSGSINNYIRYNELSLNQRFEIESKSEYLRNVGGLWLVLGVVLSILDNSINFWVYVGMVCIAVYYFNSTKYTIIPSGQGNILVLHDNIHDTIIDTMIEKRNKSVLNEMGEIDYYRTFEDERRKYKALLDASIIGESQFNEYLETMEKNKTRFKPEN